jgi:hypothetical protein
VDKRVFALVTALILAGCRVGMTTRDFEPARNPGGVQLQARSGSKFIAGEVLEVRGNGLLVLGNVDPPKQPPGASAAPRRVIFLPYALLTSVRVHQLNDSAQVDSGRITEKGRERLRRLSRFPQGLSPELLSQLLQAAGQTEVDQVRQ